MIDFGSRYVQGFMIFFVTLVAIPSFWDFVFSSPSNARATVGTPGQVTEGRALLQPLAAHAKSNPHGVRHAFIVSFRKCAARYTDAELPNYFYDSTGKPLADWLAFGKEIDPDQRSESAETMLMKMSREPAHIVASAQALTDKMIAERLQPELINCSLRLSIEDLNI